MLVFIPERRFGESAYSRKRVGRVSDPARWRKSLRLAAGGLILGWVGGLNAEPPRFYDLIPGSNKVYAATSEGLAIFSTNGAQLEWVRQEQGLVTNRVTALQLTRNQTLCVGTIGGLTMMNDGVVRSFTTREGLNHDCVYALAETSNGTLYAGTHRGINRLDGERFVPVDDTHEFCRRPTYDIHVAADGSIWFAKSTSLTRLLLDGRWQTFQRDPLEDGQVGRMTSNSLRDVDTDSAGRLWVATLGGLGCFDGKGWTDYYYLERFAYGRGLLYNRIQSIAFDQEGALWIAYGAGRDFDIALGVTRKVGEAWQYLTTADGLPSDCVNRVRADSDGRVWLATDAGGCVWENGRITTVFRVDPK